MCIIAAKPAGIKMPDQATITRMWYRNSDGAGIMYAKDGKVKIDKGFMTLKAFNEHLDKLRKSVNLDDVAVVMHFRITTHGGTCPENCHPFPITRSVKGLKALRQAAPIGIAHNGIIPITPRKGISDTMEYIISQLAPLYDMNHSFFKNKHAMELIKNAISSKMAFLTGSGEIYLVGEFTEDEGIQYSNSSYKPYEFTDRFISTPYSSWSYEPFSYRGTALLGEDDDVEEIPLMWAVYLPDGSYFKVDGDNEMVDDIEDLLLDERGRVYAYDWDKGYALPTPEITLYDPNGCPSKYDPNQADLEVAGDTYEAMDDRSRLAKSEPKKKGKKGKLPF